ncbi:MAG TPA: nitroreductase family deazaflavin-dependent oxidoreductase [Solirubrobacteraceae bacterium]|jgi:deazaflavin-dependent oxidoreductase (nitroreductase family)|nr:nitroreductase family deazaflavin-dependent oxidoreductase [Solirubrobacteraceae bacterium]
MELTSQTTQVATTQAATTQQEHVRGVAAEHASRHARVIRSAKDGRLLSALMLPFFAVRPPSGYGVITTTGRRTGKTRRKCVRVIRRGERAYLVQLRPPVLALERPSAIAAWVWNIRANPNVRLRMRGGTFAGVARELTEPAELEQAREAMCDTVNLFDYGECDLHLRGLPTRAKIKELHGYWFDTGVPLVVELASQGLS